MVEEYFTRTSRFWLEDGVVKSRVKEPTTFTAEFVRESVEAMAALTQGEPMPRLAFMDGVMFVDRAARNMYADSGLILAMALVAESHDGQFISDFASKTTSVPFPVGIFTTEEEALQWLAEVTTKGSDDEA